MSGSLSVIACCPGLRGASVKYLRSVWTQSVCFPWCTSPAWWKRQVKEAIVPVTVRHVACTYDTEWEKLFPLYPWNVFESVVSVWISGVLRQTFPQSLTCLFTCGYNSVVDCMKTNEGAKRLLSKLKSNTLFYVNFRPHWGIFHF